jgi:hypothetical protein
MKKTASVNEGGEKRNVDDDEKDVTRIASTTPSSVEGVESPFFPPSYRAQDAGGDDEAAAGKAKAKSFTGAVNTELGRSSHQKRRPKVSSLYVAVGQGKMVKPSSPHKAGSSSQINSPVRPSLSPSRNNSLLRGRPLAPVEFEPFSVRTVDHY